jgi:hypothetical protein
MIGWAANEARIAKRTQLSELASMISFRQIDANRSNARKSKAGQAHKRLQGFGFFGSRGIEKRRFRAQAADGRQPCLISAPLPLPLVSSGDIG